ncbi:hypothetical protein TUMSATVNIG1_28700 [Vibrio nigripulchritudo]|uniref:hypothetical protein n=1 Tax=Vibrio nigripulchritudo TaxID=28173 RepID=UPI00190B8F89|nr:hypothetical protein [Vibrio nigripulchritudo]BCL70905.1 hypothetical protein VNTUMSATTG_28420 [Vibrio nigripulchritudo]BDU32261.1 hypothetical protein TUMSATVNIG1_28700 [Vibrio nigripulchritudo]
MKIKLLLVISLASTSSLAHNTIHSTTNQITSVNDVILLSDQLDSMLNEAIVNNGNPVGATVFSENITTTEKDDSTTVTKVIYDTNDDKTAIGLNPKEIEIIREQIRQKADAYILLKDNGFDIKDGFAQGTLSGNAFVGTINSSIEIK